MTMKLFLSLVALLATEFLAIAAAPTNVAYQGNIMLARRTNQIGDNGTSITYNGSLVSTNSAYMATMLAATNAAGVLSVLTPPVALSISGTNAVINWQSGAVQTNTAPGDLYFSITNVIPGMPVTVTILPAATNCAVTFEPLFWRGAMPTQVLTNHPLSISFDPIGTTTNLVFASAIQTYP